MQILIDFCTCQNENKKIREYEMYSYFIFMKGECFKETANNLRDIAIICQKMLIEWSYYYII